MAIVSNFAATVQHKHRSGSDTNVAHVELCTSRVASSGRVVFFCELGAGRIAT